MELETFDRLLMAAPELQEFYGGIIFSVSHLPVLTQRAERRFWAVFHDQGSPGHLTLLFRSSRSDFYYFDSCGAQPLRDRALIGLRHRWPNTRISFNSTKYQSESSCLCAIFCIIFAYYAIRFDDGARALTRLFDNPRRTDENEHDRRTLKNEMIVLNWFNAKFGGVLINPRYQIEPLLNCQQ